MASPIVYAIPSTAVQHRLAHINVDDFEATPLPDFDPHGSVQIYETEITLIEDRDGVYDAALIAQFLGLAVAHQNQDDAANATQAFERALHLSRINNGLQNEEQIPILEQLIANYAKTENWMMVADRQAQLYALQRRLYSNNDPRLLPIIKAIVQRYIRATETRLNSDTIADLQKALPLVARGIDIVEKNYGPFDTRLVDLLYAQAVIQYQIERFLVETRRSISPRSEESINARNSVNNDFNRTQFKDTAPKPYDVGRRALQRRSTILSSAEQANDQQRAAALLAVADWYFIFGKRRSAQLTYQRIYQQLGDEESAQDFIGQLFDSPHPIRFTFQGKDELTPNTPYIEASFNVSTTGRADVIEIVADDSARKQASKLKRKIRATRFRPRLENGLPVAASNVTYREALEEG